MEDKAKVKLLVYATAEERRRIGARDSISRRSVRTQIPSLGQDRQSSGAGALQTIRIRSRQIQVGSVYVYTERPISLKGE